MYEEININIDEEDSSIDFSDLNEIILDRSPETKKKTENISVPSTQLFDEALENISTISGFLAAGIYNSSGDVLAHKNSKGFNFDKAGSLVIELCVASESISDKMNLGIFSFIETHTENYIFIHMFIVPGKAAMEVLLKSKGNVGLARHQMRKEGLKLVPEFK